MGDNQFASIPVALYGIILLMCGAAYYILTRCLIGHLGKSSTLGTAVGNDYKGKLSIVIYAAAVAVSLWYPKFACVLYGLVACMWLIPDRRIEKKLRGSDAHPD